MYSKPKPKLFTVTLKDCKVDTFTVGGNGGSGKDTSNTGVRVTHPESGASGKCVETRSQDKNRRLAFRKMGESKKFQAWARKKAAEMLAANDEMTIEQKVNEAMGAINLKVEIRTEKGWEEIKNDSEA